MPITITIPEQDLWDEKKLEFVNIKKQTIRLEHSLVSLSKWESKWKVPFFVAKNKTDEQTLSYIECMCITQNVNPEVFKYLSSENIGEIKDYISDKMTATTFMEDEDNEPGKINNQIITAEIIYYWMITLNIPIDFQKWHLERLITLIRVCNIKNQPDKKMSTNEIMARNTKLNAQRRAAMNSKG